MWTDSAVGRIFTELKDDGRILRLRAWLMGPTASAADQLSHREIGRMVVETLGGIRPAARNRVAVEKVISWGKNPWAGGAFSHYLKGDVQAFAHAVATTEGRLSFAGAHTEVTASGMEAALASAHRAVQPLADA